MRDVDTTPQSEGTDFTTFETPFAEAQEENHGGVAIASPKQIWFETVSPFFEGGAMPANEVESALAEAFAELRDESFDEALAFLAEETERDVADRFIGETGTFVAERERYAEARLSEVRYEAEQYLDRLSEGLGGSDLGSLAEEQLDEVLERLGPETGSLSPAGEEFVGALVRKAKSAVKHVVATAKKIGSLASPLIAPVLKKLRGLVQPLLRRVLSFAIGRLPAPLRPAARKLASRITSESVDESADETAMSPANLADVETLAEEFDAALAETIAGTLTGEREEPEREEPEAEVNGGQQLLVLAEARGILIDQLRNAEADENLAPVIENFVPALLGALRLGVNLIGRPKVVKFLAGYLAQLISRWVEPTMSRALSSAIVDTGLRLISLEAEDSGASELNEEEAAPVALTAVVEDTIRRLAEHEDYVLEDEDLMQLAAAESFSQAIATHFPQRLVRSDLQRAPFHDGAFVARRPRNVRTYRKFSRVPEVDVSAQIADSLPTFGGTSLGAAMRATGASFPLRARMHIYQAAPGTTLSAISRFDRSAAGANGTLPSTSFHPLTPQAAGMLLREPRLGAQVPRMFMGSRNRIAAGQRFYVLQPIGPSDAIASMHAPSPAALKRLAPSRAWLSVNALKGLIMIGIYLSEPEAQQISEAIRKGNGSASLLKALLQASRTIGLGTAPRAVQKEDQEEAEEQLAGSLGRMAPAAILKALRRRLAAWVLPELAKWVKANSEAFVRAAQHPDPGVTIRVRLAGVPGLGQIRQIAVGAALPGGIANVLRAMRGKPAINISVVPGRRRG